MKKTTPFEWNDQADEDFRDLKRMLSTAPVLAAPAEKEPLLLYIAATSRSVSTVMVVERPEEDKVQVAQRPVYYLSEWALELAGHTIFYEPRTTIKSQAVADFLVDWTETQYLPPPPDSTHWRMHFNGLKMQLSLGAGIMLSSPKGDRLNYRFLVQKLSGFFAGCEFLHVPRAENEVADPLAKIASSRQSIPSGVSLEHLHKPSIKLSPDSESIHVPADLAAPQNGPGTAPTDPAAPQPGPWTAPTDPAAPQPGPGTAPADPTSPQPGPGAAEPGSGAATPEPTVMAVFAGVMAPSWALPISEFLENGVLPMDETEAQQVQRRASTYSIINNELVKRSSTGVFQRCVERDRGIEILLDIHQGECGHHAASRSLVAKAFHHGFYWPTALEDAESLVLKCEGCQRFSKRNHQPASALRTTPIAWPFAVWGLDMVGPFKTARGGMTHLLVAVGKFTKWIEARPIKKLDGLTAVRFVKDIAVRYGMPNSIITDNGTNFAKDVLYCSISGIRLDLASVAHPQSNGQVERANGLILPGIKPRLVEPLIRSPGSWLDELPAVLWSLRTTPNRSTGFTPFFLVYGAEAVIPTDVEFDSSRVTMYTEAEAKEAREDGIDLLEEARLLALSRSAIYQQGPRPEFITTS
ncbi:uncharacterized protein [Aegilops tauschii subsp. strangulata]|uniref:uncharacterized protein n=1 Tax=Aegilops tauschii subsp. strangulata TaxID=200361 RepID=UPI00098A81AD|nr:uncharacterized protein LOC109777501 [Aegilops tauschii subsp. strangulata]